MKKSYEQLLSADYPETYWLNETHWADHPTTTPTLPPIVGKKGRRRDQRDEIVSPHLTGEGVGVVALWYSLACLFFTSILLFK